VEKTEISQRAEQNLAPPWQQVHAHCQPPSFPPEPSVRTCGSRITVDLRQMCHWNGLCGTWKQ